MNKKGAGNTVSRPMYRRRGETKSLQPLRPEDEIEFFEKAMHLSRQLEEVLVQFFPEQKENAAGKEKGRGGR